MPAITQGRRKKLKQCGRCSNLSLLGSIILMMGLLIGNVSEFLIGRKDGWWCLQLGPRTFSIAPDKTRLLALTQTLKEKYPKYPIKIDTNISENPWIHRDLLACKHMRVEPIWESIDEMLGYPLPKICPRCDMRRVFGEPKFTAWYNSSVQAYQCTQCRAIEYSGGLFYKKRGKR